MSVIIQARSIELTDALDSFIHKQASKLNKVSDRITGVNIYIEHLKKKSNDPKRAMVRYRVRMPGKDIVVKRYASDLYSAISDATQSAVRDVRKMKEKRTAMVRKRKYNYS